MIEYLNHYINKIDLSIKEYENFLSFMDKSFKIFTPYFDPNLNILEKNEIYTDYIRSKIIVLNKIKNNIETLLDSLLENNDVGC